MSGPRRWLRANWIALIAVAALGAGSIAWAYAFDWQNYQSNRPTAAVDVPRGEEGLLGPGRFELEGLVVLEGDSDDGPRYGVTEGTDVVVIDLRITPDPDGTEDDYVTCELRLRAPSPDGEREWWPESGNPTTYPEPEPTQFGCNVGGGPAYDYRQYFIVPSGGAEGAVLQITMLEELPRALRLR